MRAYIRTFASRYCGTISKLSIDNGSAATLALKIFLTIFVTYESNSCRYESPDVYHLKHNENITIIVTPL